MGKEKGWISLSRSIVDNWVWDNGEQFSRGQAWIDLLLSANHEDRKIMFDGKPLLVKRGSLLPLNTSLLTSGTGADIR